MEDHHHKKNTTWWCVIWKLCPFPSPPLLVEVIPKESATHIHCGTSSHLSGPLKLAVTFLGDRGSFSAIHGLFNSSQTEGATYVKPWKTDGKINREHSSKTKTVYMYMHLYGYIWRFEALYYRHKFYNFEFKVRIHLCLCVPTYLHYLFCGFHSQGFSYNMISSSFKFENYQSSPKLLMSFHTLEVHIHTSYLLARRQVVFIHFAKGYRTTLNISTVWHFQFVTTNPPKKQYFTQRRYAKIKKKIIALI